MAYTANDIISQVSGRLKDASVSNTQILRFINDANREICNRYQWDFMESSANLSTVIGTQNYTLSGIASDLQQVVNLRITSPDTYEGWLAPMTAEDFDRYNADPTSQANGTPTHYYFWNNSVYLFPVPDQVYTIQVRYIKVPTTLTTADQPDIPEEFQEVVTLGALYRAMQTNDNFDQALVIKNQMDTQVVDMLKRLRTQPTGSPRIMTTGYRRVNEGIL
jgi:hypothetical protein